MKIYTSKQLVDECRRMRLSGVQVEVKTKPPFILIQNSPVWFSCNNKNLNGVTVAHADQTEDFKRIILIERVSGDYCALGGNGVELIL